MSIERPFEMEFLPRRLRSDFSSHLPEATTGTQEQRERSFLTRALAAFAVHKLSGCTFVESAQAVVDGGGDGGIDAIHYSALSDTLWVVQSKYIDSGRGEPSLGDVSKFKNGLEDLLQGKFDAFRNNPLWSSRLPQIELYFNAPALRVRAVLVYSGVNRVSDDRLRMFEDLKHRFSPADDYFVFLPYNLTSVNDWLTGADEGPGVSKVELEIFYPGWIKEPYETIYGLVRLNEIASLHKIHGKRLIAANLRGYKGATQVNERILATLREEPHHFFYLNNGLTAYCKRLEVNNLDRADIVRKRLTARGFSIINGAQTLGSLEDSYRTTSEAAPEGFVFLKLISLERCLEDEEFAKRITQSTNFQNQIGARDFVSLDEQQERIALQLRLANIEYHYKDDDDTPDLDDTNLTLVEATTALACMEQEPTCDLCSRVLANRNSLWSFEPVYPDSELYRTRYHRLFRPDRSARTVWRAVQAQRSVIEQMRAEARSSVGIRKTFFENARWLVLNLVFLKLHPEQGEELSLSLEERAAVSASTIEFAEALWRTCEAQGLVSRRTDAAAGEPYEQPRHFRSVFCDPADCQRLRNATLGLLAR